MTKTFELINELNEVECTPKMAAYSANKLSNENKVCKDLCHACMRMTYRVIMNDA